ncbi:MAG: acetylxylan esterase [Tannerella sp.]|nr:acetylxylan esterase [Tannerella sp.]
MKKLLLILLSFASVYAYSQRDVNYDEAKVPKFELPDVLLLNNDSKVETKEQWERQRRPEVLRMFASEMYGKTPKETISVSYKILAENGKALNGKATAKQVKFIFSNGKKNIEALLLLYLPNAQKGKAPVFVGYNFKGNHSITTDTTIIYSPGFDLVTEPDNPDRRRGSQMSRWAIERIIDRGYALATMCYHDIFPDKEGFKDHSIVSLFSDYNPDSRKPDEWQAIGAWAWGSSRIVDYLETENRIDGSKIAIMGHSRQGKAALWAGAQDTRFAIVISNDSGSGGAALSKRRFGETVKIVSSIKPFWFCPAFNKYHDKEDRLPFDQHELLALVAPRALYVASAQEDLWADPKGEYLAAYYAGPVYKLYGLKPLESDVIPAIHQPVMNDIGYHIRAGVHDVTDYDWDCFLDFADLHFNK